jgi:citrate lyase beta subunit
MKLSILGEEGVVIYPTLMLVHPERVDWVEEVMEVKERQLPRVERLIRVEVEVGLGFTMLRVKMVSRVMVGQERS